MSRIIVKTDASGGDTMSVGYIVFREKDPIEEDASKVYGSFTSTHLEALAVVHGLKAAQDYYERGCIEVLTDCTGLIDNMNSNNQICSDKNISSSFIKVSNYFDDVRLRWIPRKENVDVDNLVREK